MPDAMDDHRWMQERAADYADCPPDPTAPRNIACWRCKCTVRLRLTQTLKSAGVWNGECGGCKMIYSLQEPLARAKGVT